jgi:peptidoglycan/LPS O-acetylase OafA/YrhL
MKTQATDQSLDAATTRNRRLDGIRALAALSVLIAHLIPLDSWVLHLVPAQFGVSTFFVLSGFLITRNLYAAKVRIESSTTTVRTELRRFYLRRAFRIMPIYYLSIVVFAFWVQDYAIRTEIMWLLSYTTNIGQVLGVNFGVAGHFWSLAVEEQFYLVIPLVILLLPSRIIPRLAAGCIFLSIGFKTLFGPPMFFYLVALRMPFGSLDALGAGMLLAFVSYTGVTIPRLFRRLFLVGLGLSVLFYTLITLARAGMLGLRMVGVGEIAIFHLVIAWIATGLVFAAERTQARLLDILAWRPLAYLGQISYGIYLYHFLLWLSYPAIAGLVGYRIQTPQESIWSFLFCSAVAIAIAAISWHCIEAPILRLKDRFAP